jgi:hypothetical protein
MRHILLSISTVMSAAAFAGFASPVTLASAQIVNGHVSGSQCVAGSDATGGSFLSTSNMIAVGTPGNVYMLTCQFTYLVGSYPTSQESVYGFACVVSFAPVLVTFDSSFVRTPGGRGILTCRMGL